MKKLFLILLLLSYSCGNSDSIDLDDLAYNPIDANYVKNQLTSSTWKVVKFRYNNIDETTLFSSYVFKFDNSPRFVNVGNGVDSYVGGWNASERLNTDVDSFGIKNIFISFNFDSTVDFSKFNGNWDFISLTSTRMELTKKNGNETYLLTLEKIIN